MLTVMAKRNLLNHSGRFFANFIFPSSSAFRFVFVNNFFKQAQKQTNEKEPGRKNKNFIFSSCSASRFVFVNN